MKHIGGYVLVDFGGLELAESEQSIPGLYKRCEEALATKKQVLAENCFYATEPTSPIPAFAYQSSSTEISFIVSVFLVVVDNENEVTITNMAK